MSHKTYDEIWHKTQELLSAALEHEPGQVNRREQRTLLATLYIRYIIICNRLSTIVDQMVQPQKKILIRKVLEAALGRVLELKSDLVEADLNEWTHAGDVFDTLNITPLEAELKLPLCFKLERKRELEYKKNTIDYTLKKFGYVEKKEKKPPMTEHQAILIIQIHERSRQGRTRAQFMKEIRSMKEKSKPTGAELAEDEDEGKLLGLSLAAALRIQTIWRGYVARRVIRRRKYQEMLLIGMIPPVKYDRREISKDSENQEYRLNLQKMRRDIYDEAVRKCREHLEATRRGATLEQLTDQVRAWIYEYKTQTGKIPEYTGPQKPGSRLTYSRQDTDSEMSKSTTKSTAVSSKDSKSKKEKNLKAKEGEEEIDNKSIMSSFMPDMFNYKEEYEEVWRNKDETSNPKQLHYGDMIEQEQLAEMEDELRKVVDDLMKNELEILKEAFEKDKGHKGKKAKRASKKARKGGKKSKKKKEKDLTPDRTTESLFEELVANGIIKKCPEVRIDDFKGEKSYHSAAPFNQGTPPKVALGDFRQIIKEYCILPLLSDKIHQQTPHIKSLLLAGPSGSGKNMLLQAICHESGSTLFDLTPANIVGKYQGKSGLIMLMHLVSKVSKLLQPSVIVMSAAEKPFMKKVPKTDKTDPKRLKKDLPKFIKSLSQEDRVMLIGISNCPWEADQKLLQQVYQRYLLIPRPDYSSRFCLWKSCLETFNALSWQFDLSIMSKISDGYTAGSIVSTVNEVMTVKRVLQLQIKPLNLLELINVLCKSNPVYREEEETMETWLGKTPLQKKRLKAIEAYLQELNELKPK